MYVHGKKKDHPVNKLILKVCSKQNGPEGLENLGSESYNQPTPIPIRLEKPGILIFQTSYAICSSVNDKEEELGNNEEK